MTIQRTYIYEATPSKDADQAGIVTAMVAIGELLTKHNKHVVEVKMSLAGPAVEIRLTMSGHDQWWIKKRVVYPIAQLLNQGGMTVDQAKLIGVEAPPDGRVTRARASDGSHNALHPDEMIDHADMMKPS